ncbi:hypothetical protein SAY87_025382 [Trapa incisa]|uniref:BHLH domain-containing protein n=1 Tax=Trapa incisa TaxID=236973 RepID=A0AAN7GQN5_9MYRT|nr:hypothetical protein SAY87_025382 [Trapa incisa]
MMDHDTTNIFEEIDDFSFDCPSSPDDLFSILDSLDKEAAHLDDDQPRVSPKRREAQKSSPHHAGDESNVEVDEAATSKGPLKRSKRPRAEQRPMVHISVERNRRKQMNEHLSVLRSLMPCFYVKRGDQASIVGAVVDYINELQQVLQSLEAKKQRKVYADTVLSPRPVLSPRLKPPLSPRLTGLPLSPRTPQYPSSPYMPWLVQNQAASGRCSGGTSSPSPRTTSASPSIYENLNEFTAKSTSSVADVEVMFSCGNLVLKTVSRRMPCQVAKIIAVLEELSLEILQVNINTMDEKMVNSFIIKIGIECQLSADDLARHIQQTYN